MKRLGGWPVGGGAQRANCAAPERAGTDRPQATTTLYR